MEQTTKEVLKTNRGLIKDIIFSILTLGIYSIYMVHAMAREVNISCKADGKHTRGLAFYIICTILTLGIYGFFWNIFVAERMDKFLTSKGLSSHISGLGYFLWSTFGLLLFGLGALVARHKILANLNKVNSVYNGYLN